MHDVFISYSTKDADIAECACKSIESAGIPCWIAPRDEIGGRNYAGAIVEAIHNSHILLLISSSSILSSDHVLSEVAIAFDAKIIILPFKIDVSSYNDNYKYYLSRKHWINAFPEPQLKLQELLETIQYLLANNGLSVDTKGDKGLAAIAEKNKLSFISQNKEKRFASCLSIENNQYCDRFHRYDLIRRIDVLHSDTGNYSSYRWLSLTNVSSSPTTFIYHLECGETKAHFSKLRVKAKENNVQGPSLAVESIIDVQPNFLQAFKIHFPRVLMPGESINIFYRLDWPGELGSYYEGELSQSISLSRYLCGTKKLVFGILDKSNIYDFTLSKLSEDYFEEICTETPTLFCADDEPEFSNMPAKNFKGAYFTVEETAGARLFRILYKCMLPIEEDLF